MSFALAAFYCIAMTIYYVALETYPEQELGWFGRVTILLLIAFSAWLLFALWKDRLYQLTAAHLFYGAAVLATAISVLMPEPENGETYPLTESLFVAGLFSSHFVISWLLSAWAVRSSSRDFQVGEEKAQ